MLKNLVAARQAQPSARPDSNLAHIQQQKPSLFSFKWFGHKPDTQQNQGTELGVFNKQPDQVIPRDDSSPRPAGLPYLPASLIAKENADIIPREVIKAATPASQVDFPLTKIYPRVSFERNSSKPNNILMYKQLDAMINYDPGAIKKIEIIDWFFKFIDDIQKLKNSGVEIQQNRAKIISSLMKLNIPDFDPIAFFDLLFYSYSKKYNTKELKYSGSVHKIRGEFFKHLEAMLFRSINAQQRVQWISFSDDDVPKINLAEMKKALRDGADPYKVAELLFIYREP